MSFACCNGRKALLGGKNARFASVFRFDCETPLYLFGGTGVGTGNSARAEKVNIKCVLIGGVR